MHTFVANFLGYATTKSYWNWIIFSQVFAKVKGWRFFKHSVESHLYVQGGRLISGSFCRCFRKHRFGRHGIIPRWMWTVVQKWRSFVSGWTVNYGKPVVTREPVSQKALRFGNITMVCEAASSSDSMMTISWKKENQVRSWIVSVFNVLLMQWSGREFLIAHSLSAYHVVSVGWRY